MSRLRDALIDVDVSIDELKKAVYAKDTLRISDDEANVYKAMVVKLNDIIGLINYIGANKNELCETTSKNTLKY